ncbi:chorismate mutase [Trichophaea hybrida]|nr:chorismate mutase [Trichophaea hybrida]
MPTTKTSHNLTTSDSNLSTTISSNNTTLTLSDLPDASTLQLPSDIAATYPSASDATTMAHVRTAIDDLDRQIVTLLGKRMRYIEAAARIKPNREAVRDQWRVDDVISKVKAKAGEVDFPKELAGEVYAVLVEGSIRHEDRRWVERRGE